MKVRAISPRDFFHEGTIDVFKWIGNSTERCEEFMLAVAAVSRHELWEADIRQIPRVAYDVSSDSTYFIFKIDNNGSTFLVGRQLPTVDKQDSWDEAPIMVEIRGGRIRFRPELTPSIDASYKVSDKVVSVSGSIEFDDDDEPL